MLRAIGAVGASPSRAWRWLPLILGCCVAWLPFADATMNSDDAKVEVVVTLVITFMVRQTPARFIFHGQLSLLTRIRALCRCAGRI